MSIVITKHKTQLKDLIHNHIYWVESKDKTTLYRCKYNTIQYETELRLPEGRESLSKSDEHRESSRILQLHVFNKVPTRELFIYDEQLHGNIYSESSSPTHSRRTTRKSKVIT
jgi:hypothetical protein